MKAHLQDDDQTKEVSCEREVCVTYTAVIFVMPIVTGSIFIHNFIDYNQNQTSEECHYPNVPLLSHMLL